MNILFLLNMNDKDYISFKNLHWLDISKFETKKDVDLRVI